jgi:hypothetical protein
MFIRLSLLRLSVTCIVTMAAVALSGCDSVSEYKLKTSNVADPEQRLYDVLDDLDRQRKAHRDAGASDADEQAYGALVQQAMRDCEKQLEARGESPGAAKRMTSEWALAQTRRSK